ncbi:MAG TPA: type IV secretion system protein [Streptosporangiaceae bacterium]|nr:type IV secretion system protein [Streptosporangiaceae bacterium]
MASLFFRIPSAVRRLAVAAGALIAVLGIVVLAFPAAARAATVSAPAASVQPIRAGSAAITPVLATTPARPAAPSGACQVPGIGDIGGLLGFCAAGSSGLIGDLNNICQPSVPVPESATGGIDSLIRPPATAGRQTPTLYDSYGVGGQSWAAYDLQCSDMTSLIGNDVAGMVFDGAKALDRVTITVYQSAAGEGILAWLTNSVDRLITSLGNAIYFPYLAPVVILGAIWLAWQGLIRKRATRTIEGTVWMVVACAAAIWLIGRPADFTGLGKGVSDGISQTLNVAFAGLPHPAQGSCVPVRGKDPQVQTASYNYSSGGTLVDQNANQLWTVLICKPWLDGEFGTTAYSSGRGAKPTVVNDYARQLLWSQAIAANEKPTAGLIQAKQNSYAGIASSIKQNHAAVYPLFQGKQWTTRLEIAFAALFAALIAGVLVLLIAITLIILKLGFLLLLVAGPFFLIVGTHPGFGRVVALRWVEMLIGVLLKQAAVALVLSVLLYAYTLIMGTSDAALPWALKILMIALVTVAVFIYRKPFVHLFSAVGYGMVGSRERAEAGLAQAASTARRNTLDAATVGVPGFAAYRAARWARRNPAQAAALAGQVATAGAAAGAAAAGASAASGAAGAGAAASGAAAAGSRAEEGGQAPENAAGDDGQAADGAAGRSGLATRGRTRAVAGARHQPDAAPPLDLPSRDGNGRPHTSGWARSGAEDTAAGRSAAGNGRRVPPPVPVRTSRTDRGGGPAGPGVTGNGWPAPGSGGGGGPAPGSGAAPRQPAARRAWPGVGLSGAGSAPRRGSGGGADRNGGVNRNGGGAAPGLGYPSARSAPAPRNAPPVRGTAAPGSGGASAGPARGGGASAGGAPRGGGGSASAPRARTSRPSDPPSRSAPPTTGPWARSGPPTRSGRPPSGPWAPRDPAARGSDPAPRGVAPGAGSPPPATPRRATPPPAAPGGSTAPAASGRANPGGSAGPVGKPADQESSGPSVPFWLRPLHRKK